MSLVLLIFTEKTFKLLFKIALNSNIHVCLKTCSDWRWRQLLESSLVNSLNNLVLAFEDTFYVNLNVLVLYLITDFFLNLIEKGLFKSAIQ